MLRNFFKIALRNVIRRKGFSFINITGLAIGMSSAILILLWVQDEISFDRFHSKRDRLYEIFTNAVSDGKVQTSIYTPQRMGPALKQDYPGIESTTRLGGTGDVLFSYKEKNLKIKGTWVDPAFLTMFDFPLVEGNAKTALDDPHAVVFTQKAAEALFGNEDPLGKTVKFDNDQNFTVTGVVKNVAANTQFDFDYLNSSRYLESRNFIDKDWTDVSIKTFVLLKPNTSLEQTNGQIKNITTRYSGGRATGKPEVFLYPLSKLRLYGEFENGKPSGGRITTIRLFILVASFILLIACINFMNLSTALGERRAKEVGIRKVSGAVKKSLVIQFLFESVTLSFIAGIIAWAIVQLSLPAFNNLTQKKLFIDFGNIYFWVAAIGFILFTGLVAGSYPAFFLSSFKPALVLKGTFKKINALITPRKALVVLQFTFAIILIISTIIVEKQIKYAQNRRVGYDRNNLVYIYLEGDLYKNYDLVKNDLLSSGTATSISRTLAPLTEIWSAGDNLKWEGSDPKVNIGFIRTSTDGNIVKTAGLQLVSGRDIDPKNYPTDSTACLINEAAAKVMGFKKPIGQWVTDNPTTWHIVGVIKDFVIESPYQPIMPLIVKGPKSGQFVMNIKLNNQNSTAENLATTGKIFKKYNPSYPFEYHFMDEQYAKKFSEEQQIGTLAGLFAGLTILISCLGLFGLATFMAESRTKEIGIRKVLGASVANITTLLTKDFVRLVIIAVVIASPIAWWATREWLQGFPYRTSVNAWIFIGAGGLAILIALCTVSYQSIKAAIANPSKSLRTE